MEPLILGETEHWGSVRALGLAADDRRSHVYVLGQTGVGKSTLLRSLLAQDIAAGRGCALLDPHGDLARELLELVPPWRTDEVVYFDPAELTRPPALNPLGAVAADERHQVVEDVVAVFSSLWGLSPAATPRLLHLLTNAIAALLDVPSGASLLGLPRLLTDAAYRRRVVGHVRNPQVRRFWEAEFGAWPVRQQQEASASVLNKAEMLVLSPVLRNTLGQVRATVRPGEILDGRRILIANLSKGRLGETASLLLGGLLLASFKLAAFRRARLAEEARQDFTLYADEFQAFVTGDVATLLSESRKLRLSLVLSHQYLGQLPAEIRRAVLGNVGTLVAFRLGEEDARALSAELGHAPSTLAGLGRGEAVMRLLQGGMTQEPRLARTLPWPGRRYGRGGNVLAQSRQRYTRRREVVEERILRWLR